MIAALLAVSLAVASDLERPKDPTPTKNECPKAYALRPGQPPPAELVDETTGLVKCGAVAEPTSRLAYLLAVEKHRDALERLWVLDVEMLKTERNFYRDRYLDAASPPWYRTPAANRWAGRLETLVAVAVVGVLTSNGGAYGQD